MLRRIVGCCPQITGRAAPFIRRSRISWVRSYNSHPEPIKETWRKRLAKLDSLFLTGVTRFHEITGYAEIEKMKHDLEVLEEKVKHTRTKVREAREQYNESLAKRTGSQSEMNELLMRKQTWLPNDLERFTQLYKDDHQLQLAVNAAKNRYDEVESQLEDLQLQAGKLIGARYREEQLWSDKIRQASTWGTWVLMGINIVLFVVVQLILEPWKRRRLVNAFELKVQHMLDEREILPHTEDLTETSRNTSENAIETDKTTKEKMLWSSLRDRVVTSDYRHMQPVIYMRPIELLTLTVVGGGVMVGTISALISMLAR